MRPSEQAVNIEKWARSVPRIDEMFRRVSILLVAFLLTPKAYAVIHVWLDKGPNDDFASAEDAKLPEFRRAAYSIKKLERLAVLDRTKVAADQGNNPHPAASYADLVKRLGGPVELDESLYARSCTGSIVTSLEGIRQIDVEDFAERTKFFAHEDAGGVMVFFSAEGKAYAPSVTYFRIDDECPNLDSAEKLQQRLKWERAKLTRMMKWLDISEEEVAVTDEELRALDEFKRRLHETFFPPRAKVVGDD